MKHFVYGSEGLIHRIVLCGQSYPATSEKLI